MPGKVADASVLAAMFFREVRAVEAETLLGGGELYEPALLAYELTSVAHKKIRETPDLTDAVAQALESALSMDVHWVAADHLAVLRLALRTGLTTYDASYLHVARAMDMPLVTFDKKLRRVAAALT
jgi:predicted nucleic acid-binding protein